MESTTTNTDPVAILRGLDAGAIEARLNALAQEQASLRVLLRSTRARDSAAKRKENKKAITP